MHGLGHVFKLGTEPVFEYARSPIDTRFEYAQSPVSSPPQGYPYPRTVTGQIRRGASCDLMCDVTREMEARGGA